MQGTSVMSDLYKERLAKKTKKREGAGGREEQWGEGAEAEL